jgi:hypothetical protein
VSRVDKYYVVQVDVVARQGECSARTNRWGER